MTQSNESNDISDWSPEKKAEAAQWLLEKRINRMKDQMPPKVFQEVMMALAILMAWDYAGRR